MSNSVIFALPIQPGQLLAEHVNEIRTQLNETAKAIKQNDTSTALLRLTFADEQLAFLQKLANQTILNTSVPPIDFDTLQSFLKDYSRNITSPDTVRNCVLKYDGDTDKVLQCLGGRS